jgi:hypothetical protein
MEGGNMKEAEVDLVVEYLSNIMQIKAIAVSSFSCLGHR